MGELSINESMKLSEHFSLGELTKTSYHTTDGNIPSHVAIENLKRLCEGWLEELRRTYNELYGEEVKGKLKGSSCVPSVASEQSSSDRSAQEFLRPFGSKRAKLERKGQYSEIPIIISSGYRSEEVNRKCGGAKGSNHLTGCAVDIRCYGPEQMIRMAGILLDIADGTKREFDELILEKRGTTYWIHFAVRPKDNRRKILFDCR